MVTTVVVTMLKKRSLQKRYYHIIFCEEISRTDVLHLSQAPKAVFSFERKSRTELAAEKSTKKQPVVEEEDDEEEDDRPKGLLAGMFVFA